MQMVHFKQLATNRILISLVLMVGFAVVYEFYFHPFAGTFYRLGLQAYGAGDYRRAASMLEEARYYDPNNPDVLGLLGWSLLKSGKPAEAEEQFLQAERIKPHDATLQLGEVYAAIALDRPVEAGAILRRIAQERPAWVEALIARGVLFRREGLTALAAAEFRQALAQDPGNPEARRNLQELFLHHTAVQLVNPQPLPGRLSTPRRAPQKPQMVQTRPPAVTDLALAQALERRQEFPEALARYRTYLRSHPASIPALYGLGNLLIKTGSARQAAAIFRRIISIDGKNVGGLLGLAQSLAASGQWREALLRYRQVLGLDPQNYEARQGMAQVLLWTGSYAQAKTMFKALEAENPGDPVNRQGLRAIQQTVRKARWAALRPLPGSPPQAFIDYDYAYLGRHPTDHAALVELAANQARMGNYDGAISTYRKILEFYPADGDSKLQLAHALAVTQRYPEAIQMYRELLKQSPDDRGLLAALARVYLWANRKQEALEIDQRLLKQDPQNIQLMLRTAGLELSLNQDSEARETLATVAALDPGNRRAALGLAALDERRGDWKGARRQYRIVLSRDPHDTTALYGDARLAYYQGDMRKAWSEAKQVLNAEPNNVDAMLLAARIENAQGKWRQAKALVDRARQDAPASAEVGEMQQTLSREALATIHTSSTYAREVGPLTSYFSPQGVLNFRIPNEDLNAYSNAVTIGLPLLFPHSQSYFSFASMPSNSPRGVIRGAVAPSEFEYRQSTDLAPFLTLRGGIGIERFGPGNGVIIPNITFPTRPATFVPITEFAGVGYGGFTLRPTSRLSLDLDISRDGVAYTPLTVRFGVIQVRKQVGLNYQADHRDQVHITYYHDNFNSSLFDRVSNFNSQFVGLGPYGVDKATGGTLDYDRTLIQSTNFSLDGGYSGEAFGYTGPSRGVYMGFFNPAFYQRHFAVVNGQGRLWGPLSFSFGAGFGLQQLGNQQPLIAAYQLNPNLKIQVNSRFSITLGYIRYNFGQSLGPLTGNAVQISTDSKFW